MLPKRSFKPAKCKTALNLAKSRLKLMKNKKEIQLKQLRREVAQLLESGHDQTARIRVEHVVREEKTIDAYEMIQIYCELVVARLPIIESQKNCPLDLKEAIASLIFAAPRCGDIVELQDIRKHFTAKYGKEFVTAAAELRPDCGVSRTLIEKLSVKAPDGQTKVKILTAIAEEHNIKWEPNWFKDEDPMPSVDIPVPAAHTMEGSKIQMQSLDFEIADDLEEKHAHDKTRPGASSQNHTHSNNDIVPPSSTSRPDSRPPENSSEKMVFNQPSQSAESAFTTGRHNWNMEFKDATAAAQAAAESAELASRAARAAAHLSSRSNVMSDSSYGSGLPFVHGQNEDNQRNVGSGLQHNQVHRNSTSGSFNQRIPKTQNQGDVSRQGSMTEEGDATTLKDNYTRYEAQHETENKDFIESTNSRRQTRDFDSGPSTSGAEPISRPPYFQEYEIEPSENPFHEETAERKNQSSSFKTQSSAFGDESGVFANSMYDDYKHDSGDGFFGSFSRKTADQEDWHVRSANTYGEEGMTFKDHGAGNSIMESDKTYGFDSHSDIFVGMDHRIGKDFDEKGIDANAEVTFDESDSDDDFVYVSNPAVEHNFSSPAELASKGSSLKQDKPHYEPDLSESFKRSPMYSKLTEPLPVTFDDSDGESLGSEKELESGKSDRELSTYDYRKPDADPHLENMRYVEKGTADSFTSSKHVDKNQNRYYGPVSEHKSFDDIHASQSPYNRTSSVAMSTDFESRSYYGLLDEGGSKKSLQSLRISESGHPVSEFEYETQPRPEGGMELNLGSLPGGRRNRPHLRSSVGGLADASSPSRSTEVAPSDSFGSTEKASTRKFQVSSNQMDNEQIPTKMTGVRAHYDSPDDDTEVVITRKGSASAGGPYRPTMNENVSKLSPKDPTGYFVNDESSSEEDVPRPVMNRTSVGAGLSRRTKGSAPRAVARSEATSAVPKTVPSSSSYTTEVSSSKTIDQSSWDAEASNHDIKLNSSKAEKPTTRKSHNVPEASNSNEKAPTKENLSKKPSHVHPKLPDFETFAATLQSLRQNRQ